MFWYKILVLIRLKDVKKYERKDYSNLNREETILNTLFDKLFEISCTTILNSLQICKNKATATRKQSRFIDEKRKSNYFGENKTFAILEKNLLRR
jgi:hypothetical protein